MPARQFLLIKVQHFSTFAYSGNKAKTALKEINNVIGQEIVGLTRRRVTENHRTGNSPFNPTDNLRSTKGMAGIANFYKFTLEEGGIKVFCRTSTKMPYGWVQEQGRVIYAKKPMKVYYIADQTTYKPKMIIVGGLFIPLNTNVDTVPQNIRNLILGVDYIKAPLAVIPGRFPLLKAIQQIIYNTGSPEHERVTIKIKQALDNLMKGPIHV